MKAPQKFRGLALAMCVSGFWVHCAGQTNPPEEDEDEQQAAGSSAGGTTESSDAAGGQAGEQAQQGDADSEPPEEPLPDTEARPMQPRPSAGCGQSAVASGAYARRTVTVAGVSRTYFLWVPTGYQPDQPYPVLFQFHGTGGTAPGNAQGVERSEAGRAAILISPQGINGVWALGVEGTDVAFFDAMYKEITQSLCVDQRRVFAMGFSRGGAMSNLLGCVRGDRIRGIGPLAGWHPAPASSCIGKPAAWIVHGLSDEVVPINQGTRARSLWLARSSCTDEAKPVDPNPCVAYEGCDESGPVVWCGISGGHGAVIEYAAPLIWKFFAAL